MRMLLIYTLVRPERRNSLMYRLKWLVPAVALSMIGLYSFAAEEKGKEAEKQALAKDVGAAKVSLEKGLSASEAQDRGRKISALGLHRQGGELLRGHRRSSNRQGGEDRTDHQRR